MASIVDAVFIPFSALFVLVFLFPVILLAPQTSADFRRTTSWGISGTAVQATISTFYQDRYESGSNLTNYEALSYSLSSKGRTLDKTTFYEALPDMFHYMKISFSSPYSNSQPDLKPTIGSYDPKKRTFVFKSRIPLRGGEVGDVVVRYQIE